MSVVLSGGSVVTALDPPAISFADVVVEAGRVTAFGTAAPPGSTAIDCAGCLVIPGNVCAHHHLYSSLARGMPYRIDPPRDFVEILQRVWWRLDRALDPASIRVSAWVGGADALLAGTTTIVDHHASPGAIDESLDWLDESLGGLGVRRVVCYEVTDRDGTEGAARGLEESRRRLKATGLGGSAAEARTRTMVGAHASFTLSDESLRACVDLAREYDVGIHVHVAEDLADEEDAVARSGLRAVERLADAGVLDDRALLAHCVHVDEDEVARIRDSGAWVAHNARSNMNNRVGRAPASALGDRVVLGTDGIDGDLFAESKAAYWRGREADPSITPEWVLGRLAAGSAFAGRAFGEPLLGRIEPGAPADLVVLDYDSPTPVTGENLAGHWIFGLSARDVRDVLVAGDVVVRDRRLVRGGDVEEMRAVAQSHAVDLWERMDRLPPHPFEPAGRS